jgi:hypothetical protein
MTVQQQTPINRYVGNGVTTVYATNFKALAKGDVAAWIDGAKKTVDVDFTVTGLAADTGFTVTWATAPANATNVVIARQSTVQRLADYQTLGDFNTNTVNPDFDNPVLVLQELKEADSRSFQLPVTDPSSSLIDWSSLLSLANRKGKFFGFFNATTGAPELYTTLPAGTPLSKSGIATLLNNQTAGEVAAGATPVNYQYPVGHVDRYATNTTPGTTDMVAAFNAAYQVAKQTGCSVQWGDTAPYRLNSPVNCTQMRGITSWDRSSKNLSTGSPSVIIAHDGQTYSHGFDLSASTEMVFYDVIAGNLAGKIPNCVFFCARNSVGSGAGIHRFYNFRTAFGCTFRHLYYCYGSEENNFYSAALYNAQGGSTLININAANPSGYTSSFMTIATGVQSNVTHRFHGCNFFQFGNSGSVNESVFQINGGGDISCTDGAWYNPHGIAYVNVIGTSGVPRVAFERMRGEIDGVNTTLYGIYVQTTGTTGVNSHAKWSFRDCDSNTSAEFMRLVDTAEITQLDITNCNAISGLLLSVYNMSYSQIVHNTSIVVGRVGGLVANCTFIGNRAQVTLSGTNSLNSGFNQTLGRIWETGDSQTGASAACTGAITAAAGWTLTRFGGTVLLALPAVVQTSPTAAASFTFASVIPAGYRPSANLRFPVVIQDNNNVLNQLGFVFINSATGAISVFKDVVGTGLWTAAGTGGMPAPVSLPWSV